VDDPILKIEVRYTCRLCGVHDARVAIKARGEEDVKTWMDQTMIQAVARDHSKRSPRCPATSISEVKIPITGADKIGGVAKN
jgi:hypothetical protein